MASVDLRYTGEKKLVGMKRSSDPEEEKQDSQGKMVKIYLRSSTKQEDGSALRIKLRLNRAKVSVQPRPHQACQGSSTQPSEPCRTITLEATQAPGRLRPSTGSSGFSVLGLALVLSALGNSAVSGSINRPDY